MCTRWFSQRLSRKCVQRREEKSCGEEEHVTVNISYNKYKTKPLLSSCVVHAGDSARVEMTGWMEIEVIKAHEVKFACTEWFLTSINTKELNNFI